VRVDVIHQLKTQNFRFGDGGSPLFFVLEIADKVHGDKTENVAKQFLRVWLFFLGQLSDGVLDEVGNFFVLKPPALRAEGLITYANGVRYGFYCMNNYACDEPIEIRLYCEKGKAVFGYDEARIEYTDGSVEEVIKREDIPVYEGGKDYWGFQHVRQIRQFYDALLKKEPLEISGEEALKSHRLIMQLYKTGRAGMR